MKKLCMLSAALILVTGLYAQKEKANEKAKKEARDVILGSEKSSGGSDQPAGQQTTKRSNDPVWEGTAEKGGPKPSKNQPAKVRAAFQKDYPNASNVRWSKYRGDWTATFGNGAGTSTAVYHANGQRKDTRTVVPRPQLPKVILDDILKKRPRTQLGDIVKIEVPQTVKDIFRIKTMEGGTARFVFYDAKGAEVKYDY